MNTSDFSTAGQGKPVMSLRDIAGSLVDIAPSCNVKISGIQSDSRKVKEGDLFLAFPGAVSDGRDFIDGVIQQGAAAVFFEDASCTKKVSTALNDLQKNYSHIPLISVKGLGIVFLNQIEYLPLPWM